MQNQMMSLFDYLGKPAGGVVGSQVYAAAKAQKEYVEGRDIHTKTYSGKVLLYRKEFLDSYFSEKEVDISLGDQQDYTI